MEETFKAGDDCYLTTTVGGYSAGTRVVVTEHPAAGDDVAVVWRSGVANDLFFVEEDELTLVRHRNCDYDKYPDDYKKVLSSNGPYYTRKVAA